MKLKQSFYKSDDVTRIARSLLGKVLHVASEGITCSGRIVETEAYSYREKACHAFLNRRTGRTETLFAEGGTAYVYLCYGIHRLFNIVTNEKDVAEAVLIRALEPLDGIDTMKYRRNKEKTVQLTSGPGNLTQALNIQLHHDKESLLGDQIWISSEAKPLDESLIVSGPRIGIDYAEEDALLPWRYGIRDSRFLSKPFG